MTRVLAAVLLLTTSACAATPPAEAEEVPVRGTGRICDASKARDLVGRAASSELGAEALRKTGAGALRWIPEGGMVTMDYREDRLNLHLDGANKVVKIACG